MKKVLLTGLMILCFSFGMLADNVKVPISIKKGKANGIGNSFGHAPMMNLPIEVTFDDATGVLTVQAPENLEGAVNVYSAGRILEASSDHLNTTLTLTSTGLHIVSIEGENWIGEGYINPDLSYDVTFDLSDYDLETQNDGKIFINCNNGFCIYGTV